MPTRGHEKRLWFRDPDDFVRVRDVLAAANYTQAGICELLGCEQQVIAVNVPSLVYRRKETTPLDTLTRLFYFNLPADLDAARQAIQPMSLESWVEAGLLEFQGSSIVSLIRLLPYAGLLLACDVEARSAAEGDADMVMNVGGSTLALARMTIRRPVPSTLDLGTGCGIQAFLAARHSQQVCAVDRNRRAIDFAVFNARLNELTNVAFLEGDLCEPVQGSQFDLIVCNPPYVISPEFRAHYRDSGMTGDTFCQKIIRQAAPLLREGGYCQIISNVAHLAGQKWQDRLAGWFEGSHCDVWVMRRECRELSEYVISWNRGRAGQPGFTEIYDNWMAYYQRQRIEAISLCAITMRRSARRPNWFQAHDGPKTISGFLGDEILRTFEAFDFLNAVRDDQALLDARLRFSPDIRIRQSLEPSRAGWRIAASQLHRTRGLCYSGDIDAETANLLLQCDGKRSVRQLLVDLAARRNVTLESMISAYPAILRRLIGRGFLLPARGDEQATGPTATPVALDPPIELSV